MGTLSLSPRSTYMLGSSYFVGFAPKPCVLFACDLLRYSVFFSDFGLGRTYKLL